MLDKFPLPWSVGKVTFKGIEVKDATGKYVCSAYSAKIAESIITKMNTCMSEPTNVQGVVEKVKPPTFEVEQYAKLQREKENVLKNESGLDKMLIEKIKQIDIKEGDTLVFEYEGYLSHMRVSNFCNGVRGLFNNKVKCILLEGGVKLAGVIENV